MKFCLVVEKEYLWNGIAPLVMNGKMHAIDRVGLMETVERHAFYIERGYAEEKEKYQQIIPTVVFENDQGEFLLYRRRGDHTEGRLANKWTCLFGGHIDPEDSGAEKGWGTLVNAWQREAREEAGYEVSDNHFMSGPGEGNDAEVFMIRDGRDDVGCVHLGLMTVVKVKPDELKFGEEIAETEWVKPAEIKRDLEGWAELALQSLECERNGS